MLRIAGILGQQFTGNSRAFAAVEEPFLLAAHGNGTLAVKWVSVGFDTSAAAEGFFIGTFTAEKPTSGVNHMDYLRFLKTTISGSEPFSPYSQTER